jgi:hypothetical protein
MKNIFTIPSQIANLEIQRDNLSQELTVLNSEYEGIKYRKDDDSMAKKSANRSRCSLIRVEIKNINSELKRLEYDLENGKVRLISTILWIVFGLMFIIGVVILYVYKYRLGMYGFTELHDVWSMLEGENPIMDYALYRQLFWVHTIGTWTTIVGVVGSLATSGWRISRNF